MNSPLQFTIAGAMLVGHCVLSRFLDSRLADRKATRDLKALQAAVKDHLVLLSECDPNAGPTRHPEWPIKLHGEASAIRNLVATLTALSAMVGGDFKWSFKPSKITRR